MSHFFPGNQSISEINYIYQIVLWTLSIHIHNQINKVRIIVSFLFTMQN